MTDNVNEEIIRFEANEAVAPKFYKLDFAYSDPVTGFVYVSASSRADAVAVAKSAVPDEISDFEITGIEEVVDLATQELLKAKEAGTTIQ